MVGPDGGRGHFSNRVNTALKLDLEYS